MISKTGSQSLDIVDATIDELQHALSSGLTTCVDLVAAYLDQISAYDCRGPTLNSIPVLNQNVFAEAAASDERRASGSPLGPLEGIPFTVKDSYKVKGQTAASGSPAFQDLIANEDAFTVRKLREAGAVLIGRTNMCPMAAGGMQRGVYGRAESPYNKDFLAAAFASGSSNGSGVSTGASFAAFGMGEETVSSGRSPASNNALVAYTPSRGAISIRGNWPLYPTCDVVVPHARSMGDMLTILDVITAKDTITRGDFWRDQPFIALPQPWANRPSSLREIQPNASIAGRRIAVPSMYTGGKPIPGSAPVYTSSEVISLYKRARSDLEALGAEVIEIDEFPVIENYEYANTSSTLLPEAYRLPEGWNTTERSMLIAYAWEQFLRENNDFNVASLEQVDYTQIYPAHPADDPQVRYTEPANRIHYEKLQSYIRNATSGDEKESFEPRSALMFTSGLEAALRALESIREVFFEQWLEKHSFDFVAFPACGDVGRSDADIDFESAEHAWQNGVKYSNGNRALRHVGIPSVTIPMGNIESKSMPVGLTFLAKSGEDMKLLQCAAAYENASRRRVVPSLTPEIRSEPKAGVGVSLRACHSKTARPELQIEKCVAIPSSRNMLRVNVEGFITCVKAEPGDQMVPPSLDIIINGRPVPKKKLSLQQCDGTMCGRPVYDFRCNIIVPEPPQQDPRNRVTLRKRIARDSTMVVVVAAQGNGSRKTGYLKLL